MEKEAMKHFIKVFSDELKNETGIYEIANRDSKDFVFPHGTYSFYIFDGMKKIENGKERFYTMNYTHTTFIGSVISAEEILKERGEIPQKMDGSIYKALIRSPFGTVHGMGYRDTLISEDNVHFAVEQVLE